MSERLLNEPITITWTSAYDGEVHTVSVRQFTWRDYARLQRLARAEFGVSVVPPDEDVWRLWAEVTAAFQQTTPAITMDEVMGMFALNDTEGLNVALRIRLAANTGSDDVTGARSEPPVSESPLEPEGGKKGVN